MAAALVSCNSSAPSPQPLGSSGIGDPLSVPLGGTTQAQPQTPAPTPPPKVNLDPSKHPLAVKTPDPEIVLSPHKPYNKVRVDPNKFKSGDIAEDPDNRGKYFRVP